MRQLMMMFIYDTECKKTAASLGTEEMAHFEMVATIVHQLTRNLTPEEIKESGFGDYYIDHTLESIKRPNIEKCQAGAGKLL